MHKHLGKMSLAIAAASGALAFSSHASAQTMAVTDSCSCAYDTVNDFDVCPIGYAPDPLYKQCQWSFSPAGPHVPGDLGTWVSWSASASFSAGGAPGAGGGGTTGVVEVVWDRCGAPYNAPLTTVAPKFSSAVTAQGSWTAGLTFDSNVLNSAVQSVIDRTGWQFTSSTSWFPPFNTSYSSTWSKALTSEVTVTLSIPGCSIGKAKATAMFLQGVNVYVDVTGTWWSQKICRSLNNMFDPNTTQTRTQNSCPAETYLTANGTGTALYIFGADSLSQCTGVACPSPMPSGMPSAPPPP